jgi:hypothetical protein
MLKHNLTKVLWRVPYRSFVKSEIIRAKFVRTKFLGQKFDGKTGAKIDINSHRNHSQDGQIEAKN